MHVHITTYSFLFDLPGLSHYRSLMKRLEQFEVVEFPKSRLGNNGRSPDNLTELDCTLPFTAARVRGELEASISAASTSSSTDKTQYTKAPPPLLGPFPDDTPSGIHTTTMASVRPPSTTVIMAPVTATAPVSTTRTTPQSQSGTGQGQVGKGKKVTKKDGGATHKSYSKKRRGDVDPNAPKKPSNAFFWFCQDKRAALQEQVKVEGLGGQHDLTKALARLWSETKTEDKKVC